MGRNIISNATQFRHWQPTPGESGRKPGHQFAAMHRIAIYGSDIASGSHLVFLGLCRANEMSMSGTPSNAVPDAHQTIAELQRKLDEAELAARNSAYSERIAYQAAANDVLKVMSALPQTRPLRQPRI